MKTIVTSQMANAVADHFGVKCYDCLTGFKYIAKIIRENEGKTKYIGGGEESFGYLGGDYVRDKDAVFGVLAGRGGCSVGQGHVGLTLYEWLQELYVKYGFYREGLVSVVRKGKEGAEQIQQMMVDFRSNPPKAILGSPVVKINDFQTLEATDVKTGVKTRSIRIAATCFSGSRRRRDEGLGTSFGYGAEDQVLFRREGIASFGGRITTRCWPNWMAR